MGRSIKLLASGRRDGENVYAMVAPFMIDSQNPLYMVNDVYNGILVRSNMLGETMYYGKGAGKLPTASAVVADVIDAARHKGTTAKFLWDKEQAAGGRYQTLQEPFLRPHGGQSGGSAGKGAHISALWSPWHPLWQARQHSLPERWKRQPLKKQPRRPAASSAGFVSNKSRVETRRKLCLL